MTSPKPNGLIDVINSIQTVVFGDMPYAEITDIPYFPNSCISRYIFSLLFLQDTSYRKKRNSDQ